MASLKKRIFEAEKKVKDTKFLLDTVTANAKRAKTTGTSSPKDQETITKVKAAYDTAVKELQNLKDVQVKQKQLKADKKAGVVDVGTIKFAGDVVVDNKILRDMQNDGLIPGAIDANFFVSGPGSNMLIYKGKKTVPTTISPTGAAYQGIADNTSMANAEINRFTKDAGLKSKVLGLVKKLNPNADEIDAFNAWKEVVNSAATLYAGGTGLKITPEDLLARQVGKELSSKKTPYTGPETTLARKVYDIATVKSWIEEGLLKTLQKPSLDPEDQADLEASIQAMTQKYSKTVVTDNQKGKRVIEEKPAFSQAQIEAEIKKFAKERDPQAYERTKSQSFFDWALGL